MRVLIAPDKFKGTLTAREAAEAIARGWHKARPEDSLELLPISDGGDGFGEVMGELLGAKQQQIRTVDAAHRRCSATWWWDAKSKTAVVESARVIGLAMLPKGKFHPFELDTFGLGAVLHAAQRDGAKQIIVGIGGSATNDGGFGMARALGWKFLNADRQEIEHWTHLDHLAEVHKPSSPLSPRITVAVDVQNPLLGLRGASRVYGPQKGLRPEDFAKAERCLRRLATILKQQHDLDAARNPGAGAAGGLGFGLMVFSGARFQSGFAMVEKHSQLRQKLKHADVVITGEGAIDRTTAMGKGCGEVAGLCRTLRLPCFGLGGKVTPSHQVRKMFTRVSGLTELTSTDQACRRPVFWLRRLAEKTASNLVCKLPLRR
ncbi:MAG TPA: glycerate kinase [Verrucomicrobiae bacterium]|nr:glycerate kinase [Verrucomicrobiae bacterium]